MTAMRTARRAAMMVTLVVAVPVVAVAAGGHGPVEYTATSGAAMTGLRPTAVGLPQLGTSGTTGAGELDSALRSYHDSGRYEADLKTVGDAALAELDRRLDAGPATTKRVCKRRYVRTKRRLGGKRLYRRTKRCRTVTTPSAAPKGKPAIVLDIDETSLSNYDGLTASNFSATGTAVPAATGTGTAIAPTLALYKEARKRGVAVFFITGRPAGIQGPTETNLKAQGYDAGWDGLQFKPGDMGTEAFKAGARQAIEQRGYDIVVNVGDQESDLDGGHADRAFKLPNPFYFISD